MPAPDLIPDLVKAINDVSSRVYALWIAFVGVSIYLAVTIGATTDVQLLLNIPAASVKLPLLDANISLYQFYRVGPTLFFVIHVYVLTQLYLLAQRIILFNAELQGAQLIQRDRDRTRALLDTFAVTQVLGGLPERRLVVQIKQMIPVLSSSSPRAQKRGSMTAGLVTAALFHTNERRGVVGIKC